LWITGGVLWITLVSDGITMELTFESHVTIHLKLHTINLTAILIAHMQHLRC